MRVTRRQLRQLIQEAVLKEQDTSQAFEIITQLASGLVDELKGWTTDEERVLEYLKEIWELHHLVKQHGPGSYHAMAKMQGPWDRVKEVADKLLGEEGGLVKLIKSETIDDLEAKVVKHAVSDEISLLLNQLESAGRPW